MSGNHVPTYCVFSSVAWNQRSTMRLTPRRFVIFIFAVISLFFLISYLAPDDESHRPRPNIKARRLDNIYNNENQIIQEDKRSNESQDEKKVQSIKDSEKEIDLSKTRGKDLGKLIDWHNYTLMKLEAKREGRGEREKVKLMEEEQKSVSMGKYGYSKFVSDLVSLDRAIRDIRHPLCASKLYHENLPDTSIIMPFHNEAPSVLLRLVFPSSSSINWCMNCFIYDQCCDFSFLSKYLLYLMWMFLLFSASFVWYFVDY